MAFLNGTYQGKSVGNQATYAFEVRLDFEQHPTRKTMNSISGDMYRYEIDLDQYLGTFIGQPVVSTDGTTVDSDVILTLSAGNDFEELEGRFHCQRLNAQPDGRKLDAILVLFPSSGGEPSTYEFPMEWKSEFFRRVEIQVDLVEGTKAPETLDWHNSPLTMPGVMAHAGIELLETGPRREISSTGGALDPADPDDAWSERELDAAMKDYFASQGFADERAAWRIYLLIATWFRDPGTTGLMFDADGRHRQGAAIFYHARVENSAPSSLQRDYIRTATHELGHAFNLLHSFDEWKLFGDGKYSTSIMNYPQGYYWGEEEYWKAFTFEYDTYELTFMRHGHLEQVIMGGADFGEDGHDEVHKHDRNHAAHGLQLELRLSPKERSSFFQFGEPVWVEVKLSLTGTDEKKVQDSLEPCHRQTNYLIEQPGGKTVRFAPLTLRTSEKRELILGPDQPALYEAVQLSYSARGFCFLEPGRYRIQAVYETTEGAVRSNVCTLWVRYPTPAEENLLVPTFDGAVSHYLGLWGSPVYSKAKALLDGFLDQPGGRQHPLAAEYLRCQFHLAADGFKAIDTKSGEFTTKRTVDIDLSEVAALVGLTKKLTPAEGQQRPLLPNIVAGQLGGKLAQVLHKQGEKKEGLQVLSGTLSYLKTRGIPDWVGRCYKEKWKKRIAD